jgi:hypothetical protein
MGKLIVSLSLIMLYLTSLYGWGDLVCRLGHVRQQPWAVVATIGLASWIFLGGLLNLFGLAYAGALDAIVVCGWGLCALRAWSERGTLRSHFKGTIADLNRFDSVVLWLLIGTIVIFAIATQLPPRAYNYDDDFQKYLAYPVRMIETGTLYGSPLSSIGRTTLGGQAVLDGLILAHFPIQYVNGADAVFCLLLCLLIIRSSGALYRSSFVPTLLALLLVAVINPQYVNTSPLYSISALIMALVLTEAGPQNDLKGWEQCRPIVTVALIYAALIALKPSAAPFAGLFVILSLMFNWLRGGSVLSTVLRGFVLSIATIAFLSPWILLHLPHYRHAGNLATVLAHGATAAAPRPTYGYIMSARNPFAFATLPYGDSFLHYTIVMTGIAALGVGSARFALAPLADDGRGPICALAAACLAAAGAYAFFVSSLSRGVGDPETSLRLFCPTVIGVAPIAILLGWRFWPIGSEVGRPRFVHLVLMSFALVSLLIFSRSFVSRMAQAAEYGSILAFRPLATSKLYLDYNRAALDSETLAKVRRIQSMVPAKEPLLVWNRVPFDLDYRRNGIIDVDIAGLVNSWAELPPVRYVLWDYRGSGMKTSADCQALAQGPDEPLRQGGALCVSFRNLLDASAKQSEVLYNDGETVLFHLAEPL